MESVHTDKDNAPSTQKTTNFKWNQTFNFEDIEPFYNFQGPSHNLPVGSIKKLFQFVDRSFCEMVAEETNLPCRI
jgi:hypothetical protein